MDFQKNNILPVHKDFQTLGSNSTHTNLLSPLASSARAFQSLKTLGSNSTHTSPASSGFQYIGGGTPIILATFASSDYYPSADSLTVTSDWTKNFSDYSLSTDFVFTGTTTIYESPISTDTLSVTSDWTKTFEEGFVSTDSLDRSGNLEDLAIAGDSLSVSIVKYFNDYLANTDSVDAFMFFDATDGTTIQVTQGDQEFPSTTINVSSYDNASTAPNVVITPNNIVAVVDASSVSNPFLPTIIIDGVTFVTNACTAPAPTADPGTTRYVWLANSGIGNTTYCDMTASNMTLDYTGGTFNISSSNPLGSGTTYQTNLGEIIQAYGLTGSITDFGRNISPSEFFYQTEGIFGTPAMNKPFNLITYGSNQYFAFLNNQYGLNYVPPINSYTTVKGMANAIANLVGISLSWLVMDAPYRDIFGQNGLTGYEALSALAAQVGASLRWNGTNHYVVAYPNYFSGTWSPPSPMLIYSLRYKNHQDLGYGVSGSGVLGLPTNVYFDTSTKAVPAAATASNSEDVQKIATVTKILTSDDPPIIVDLANDTVSVKYQILVQEGQAGIGAEGVTDNPSIWFDLGNPSISNPYVKTIKVGNAFVNKLIISAALFPSLSTNAINNGNFTASFGIVRRSLNSQYEEAKTDQTLLLREIQARINANIRFIKTYSGTISCQFFGSLPLPGMWASATYCGETVEGIVESVSITGSGTITVEVAQYFQINLLDRKLMWALTSGNYTNI